MAGPPSAQGMADWLGPDDPSNPYPVAPPPDQGAQYVRGMSRMSLGDWLNSAQGQAPEDRNAPYYATGQDESNQRYWDLMMRRLGVNKMLERQAALSPEERQQQLDRAMTTGRIAGSLSPVGAVGLTGLDFAARHQDDPNWGTALVDEAAPMAATMAAGPTIRAGIRYAPQTTAAILASLGLTSGATEAGNEKPTGAHLPADQLGNVTPMSPDDAEKAMLAERSALEATKAQLKQPTPPDPTDFSKYVGRGMAGARARAAGSDRDRTTQYQTDTASFNTRMKEIDDQIAGLPAKYAPMVQAWQGLPLAQRRPLTAAGMAYGGTAAEAFLAPYLSRLIGARLNAPEMQRWEQTLNDAKGALTATTKAGNLRAAPSRLEGTKPYMGTLEQFAANPPGSSLGSKVAKGVFGGLFPAAGFVGAMASPQEYDYAFSDPNSEAHRQAAANFQDPSFWLSRLAFGAPFAGTGAALGWKLPAGETKPPLASTQGTISTFKALKSDVAKEANAKRRAERAAKSD